MAKFDWEKAKRKEMFAKWFHNQDQNKLGIKPDLGLNSNRDQVSRNSKASSKTLKETSIKPKRFRCGKCSSSCFDKIQHDIEVHNKYLCPVCGYEIAGTIELGIHIKGTHISN